jgi:hypothetical protein
MASPHNRTSKEAFMMKKLLLSTALSGLMLSGALAQAQPPAPATPPAATPPAAAPAPDSSKAAPATPGTAQRPAAPSAPQGAAAQPMAAEQKVVTSQKPDQMLASKFSGTDVLGPDDKKIGDVSDILFDKDGKIEAYVISIGGFLGVGSKDVALAPSSFQIVKGTNGAADKLKISMSQDQLKQMASFEPYQPPRPTTTGTAPGGPARPAGANR